MSGPETSTLNRCNNTIDAFTIPFLRGPPQVTSTYSCELAFKAPQLVSNISCQDLGSTVSSKMTFLEAIILHEWLHNEGIGKNVTISKGLGTDDLCALCKVNHKIVSAMQRLTLNWHFTFCGPRRMVMNLQIPNANLRYPMNLRKTTRLLHTSKARHLH